jgi:hypothetical protein
MKRSIDLGHVLALVFLYTLLFGVGYMLYDTIVHDNDTGMIVAAFIIFAVLKAAVVYCTYFFIADFRRKERRRKIQMKLMKEMKLF